MLLYENNAPLFTWCHHPSMGYFHITTVSRVLVLICMKFLCKICQWKNYCLFYESRYPSSVFASNHPLVPSFSSLAWTHVFIIFFCWFSKILSDERAGLLHRLPHRLWRHVCVVPHTARMQGMCECVIVHVLIITYEFPWSQKYSILVIFQ